MMKMPAPLPNGPFVALRAANIEVERARRELPKAACLDPEDCEAGKCTIVECDYWKAYMRLARALARKNKARAAVTELIAANK
jgi:hypothetical protein